jgi:hypothetical protein
MELKDKLVKHVRRPKKSPAEKRRRQAVQKKRLVGLGVPAEKVAKMQPGVVRTMLRHPAKIKVPAAV